MLAASPACKTMSTSLTGSGSFQILTLQATYKERTLATWDLWEDFSWVTLLTTTNLLMTSTSFESGLCTSSTAAMASCGIITSYWVGDDGWRRARCRLAGNRQGLAILTEAGRDANQRLQPVRIVLTGN